MLFIPSVPAESLAVIPGASERYVQAGSELRLGCRINKVVRSGEGPPVIRWFRNDSQVDEINDLRIEVAPSHYVKVHFLGKEAFVRSQGKYRIAAL